MRFFQIFPSLKLGFSFSLLKIQSFVYLAPVESAFWGIRLAAFVAQCISAFMSY